MQVEGMNNKWRCYICWKLQEDSLVQLNSKCCHCGRSRNMRPTSYINTKVSKPLALHGCNTNIFPYRIEQIKAMENTNYSSILAMKSVIGGYLPIHCAARVGNATSLDSIITYHKTQKVNTLEVISEDGLQPLHHAIQNRNNPAIEILLNANVNVNTRINSGEGYTPIHLAAKEGNAHLIVLLLAYGADPHIKTLIMEKTTLHLAVTSEKIDAVEVLLQVGLDPLQNDHEGISSIQEALFLQSSITKDHILQILTKATKSLIKHSVHAAPIRIPHCLSLYLSQSIPPRKEENTLHSKNN